MPEGTKVNWDAIHVLDCSTDDDGQSMSREKGEPYKVHIVDPSAGAKWLPVTNSGTVPVTDSKGDTRAISLATRNEFAGRNDLFTQVSVALSCSCGKSTQNPFALTLECEHIMTVMSNELDFTARETWEILDAAYMTYEATACLVEPWEITDGHVVEDDDDTSSVEVHGAYSKHNNAAIEWNVMIFGGNNPIRAQLHVEWNHKSPLAQVSVAVMPGDSSPQVLLEVGYMDAHTEKQWTARRLYVDFLAEQFYFPERWKRCISPSHEDRNWKVEMMAANTSTEETGPDASVNEVADAYRKNVTYRPHDHVEQSVKALLRDVHCGLMFHECPTCHFDSGVPEL